MKTYIISGERGGESGYRSAEAAGAALDPDKNQRFEFVIDARRRRKATQAESGRVGRAFRAAHPIKAARLGLAPYFTVVIPWEPRHTHRTEWHPTSPTGPLKTLTRGAFKDRTLAKKWATEHLGKGAVYSIKRIDPLGDDR